MRLELPMLLLKRPLAKRFDRANWDEIEAILPDYLERNRLVAKTRSDRAVRDHRRRPAAIGRARRLLSDRPRRATGCDGRDHFPGAWHSCPPKITHELLAPQDVAGFCPVSGPEPGLLCNALAVPGCCRALLKGMLLGRLQQVEEGEIEAATGGTPAVTRGRCRRGPGALAAPRYA